MSRLVEGLWDCPYCGQKGIGGLKKDCPNCGHPQDEGTAFYMPGDVRYIEKEKAEEYGKGADWTCSYCGSLNRYSSKNCTNCGAAREDNKGDYFANQEKTRAAKAEAAAQERAFTQPAQQKRGFPKVLALILAAIIIFGVIAAIPKKKGAELLEKDWVRQQTLQAYETVNESDWVLPSGGRLIDQKVELKEYQQVFDHNEYVQERRSRQVIDHYEIQVDYVNNGDGTFREVTRSVPVYGTEYYYETVERPVYRDEPVYATRYYYQMDRWISKDVLEAKGVNDTPYWPQYNTKSNERLVDDRQNYTLIFTVKDSRYSVEVPEMLYNKYKPGDSVEIVIQNGRITTVGGTQLY